MSASSTCACTGRYQHRSSANVSHFSASFSVISIALRVGDREVTGDEAVMIAKRVRRRRDAHRSELREKSRRMTDSGKRVDTARARRGDAGAEVSGIVDPHEPIADEPHREGTRV